MRCVWLLVLGLALFSLFSPVRAAWGAEDAPGKAVAAEHTPEGGDNIPFGPWALDLSVWTIVVFLLLLFVLKKYAWKPMLEGLDRREQAIHEALKEAQRARDEATGLRDDLQARINKAHEQVRDMLDEARKEAQAAKDETIAEARQEIQTERDRLHREMERARDQALQQIWTQAAQLAALVSSKVIRRQLTPDDHKNLIEEALADLRKAAEQRQHIVASLQ